MCGVLTVCKCGRANRKYYKGKSKRCTDCVIEANRIQARYKKGIPFFRDGVIKECTKSIATLPKDDPRYEVEIEIEINKYKREIPAKNDWRRNLNLGVS